jgi:hypothetical protein
LKKQQEKEGKKKEVSKDPLSSNNREGIIHKPEPFLLDHNSKLEEMHLLDHKDSEDRSKLVTGNKDQAIDQEVETVDLNVDRQIETSNHLPIRKTDLARFYHNPNPLYIVYSG